MSEIGLFEAKTKLSEICRKVSASGEAVVLTQRGVPLVRIEPIRNSKSKKNSVWNRRVAFERKHGPLTDDFELLPKEKQKWRNPLD